MIQKQDLKIGNWVYFTGNRNNNSIQVKELWKRELVADYAGNELCLFYTEEDLQPIPLTPEILEKCGFKNTMGDYWVKGKELMLALDKVWWWTNSWEPDGEFGFDTLAQYKEIDYLHQLQNLYYSLTQTELPITL